MRKWAFRCSASTSRLPVIRHHFSSLLHYQLPHIRELLLSSAKSHASLHHSSVVLTGRDFSQNVGLPSLDTVGNRY